MKYMKTLFIILSALLFVSVGQAQNVQPTPELYSAKTLSDLVKIQNAALKSDYAYEKTRYMSNNIGPRLSGSKQSLRAVEYVADEMRKLGLDVRLQEIMVPHWERGEEKGELVAWSGMAQGTTQKIHLGALGGSIATPNNGIMAEIVVVSSWAELNALGRSGVNGKIVLFNAKFDKRLADSGFGSAAYGQAVQFRGGGAVAAAKLGAIAVLVRSAGGSQMRMIHTGGMRYEDGVTKIPAASVTYEDAELIADLAKQGVVKMKLFMTPKTFPDAKSYNVIADLKGSEKPEEIVVVSGHLDSWDLGTGALDDACGVAAAMQVPYLLKQLGIKPKRTIRVVAYMNEENGLRGGTGYAEQEKDNIAKHFAAIESDLGASHPIGFNFAGKPEAMAYFAPLSNILKDQGAVMSQRIGGVGADIGPLTELGVPSFAPWFNTQTYFNYHHTAADTFDKIVPQELAETASLTAVLAYGMANLEQPLPR